MRAALLPSIKNNTIVIISELYLSIIIFQIGNLKTECNVAPTLLAKALLLIETYICI